MSSPDRPRQRRLTGMVYLVEDNGDAPSRETCARLLLEVSESTSYAALTCQDGRTLTLQPAPLLKRLVDHQFPERDAEPQAPRLACQDNEETGPPVDSVLRNVLV